MDRYTKTLLTIIAVALCTLVAQNMGFPRAQADTPQTLQVRLCGQVEGLNTFDCATVVPLGAQTAANKHLALRVYPN